MFIHIPRYLIIMPILLLAISTGIVFAADIDVSVEPTDYGKVMGYVYDAETMQPLGSAIVTIQESGTFAQEGKTVGSTNTSGYYQCQAKLGRKSSKVDLGRALLSSPIGILTGSANKKTRRVDVSRLILRVSCNGYHTFEGIVPCRDVEADDFAAKMEPIFLTKISSEEESTVAVGWGNAEISAVSISPTIVNPGDKVTFAITVKCPPLEAKSKAAILIQSNLFGQKKIGKYTVDQSGCYVFSTSFAVPKKAKSLSDMIEITVTNFTHYFKSDKSNYIELVQVAKNDLEKQAAEARLKAFQLQRDGNDNEALTVLKQLCALPTATPEDKSNMVTLDQRISQPEAPSTISQIVSGQELESAIAAAKIKTDADKKCENFSAWHEYALLSLRKALLQQQTNDPSAATSLLTCMDALTKALKSARAKGVEISSGKFYGVFGYYGSAVTGIAGFNIPEADSDFVILQSLKVLNTMPNSYLDLLNLGTALLGLGQADLASISIEKCLSLQPAYSDAKFAKALIELNQGNAEYAVVLFKDVVRLNPRHPQANLFLAKIYKQVQDLAAMETYQKAHESFYACDARALVSSLKLPLTNIVLEKPIPVPVEQPEIESAATIPQEEPTMITGPNCLIVNGATYVPLRAIGEWIGASLDLDRKSGIIVLKTENSTVSLKLNSTFASINGKLVQLANPTIERSGTTYVPLRFVGEAFSAEVKWDSSIRTIAVTHPSKPEVMLLTVK